MVRFFASLFPSNAGMPVVVEGNVAAMVSLNCRKCAAENSFTPSGKTQFDKGITANWGTTQSPRRVASRPSLS